jgi:hypothetical protein
MAMNKKANAEAPIAEVKPEVNQEDLAIRAAFDSNTGKDEEIVKMAMLQAGAKIKAVTRLYNQFMIDSGLMASKEEKDDALTAACTDVDLTDEDAFNDAIDSVMNAVTGADDKSAANLVRAWCRREDVDCFKKTSGERRSGFRFKFYEALKANPTMTAAEAKTFGDTEGSENDKKAFSHYQAIRDLVNAVAA